MINVKSVLFNIRDDVFARWYVLRSAAASKANVWWSSTMAPAIWAFCWSGWSDDKTADTHLRVNGTSTNVRMANTKYGHTSPSSSNLPSHEQVDGIGLLWSLDALGPLEAQHSWVLSQPPVVGLVSGQSGAVDTGAAASSQTNHHTVFGVAHRVRLGVLQGDGGHGQVNLTLLREVLVLGHNFLEGRALDDGVVSLAAQGYAIDASALQVVWSEVGVDAQNAIDDVGQGDPVSEGRHSVGTSGLGVRIGQRRQVLDILDEVDLLLGVRQGQSHSGTSRRNMLERSGSWKIQRGRQLFDQRPRVQSVQQVDVAWRAAQDLERQFALGDESLGWLAVRVGPVSQRQLADVLRVAFSEEVRDSNVVVGGVLESLKGQSVSGVGRDLSVLQFLKETSVIFRVRQDGNSSVVFGSSSQQGDTANVDFLDSLVNGHSDLGNSLFERVQVADDKIDLFDALSRQIGLIALQVSGQNTSVHCWVQRLDPATQHLRGMGDGGNVFHGKTRFTHHFGGAARSQNPDLGSNKTLGQVQQAGLVCNFKLYLYKPIARARTRTHQTATSAALARLLSVSPQGKSVVLLPGVVATSRGVVVSVALVDTSGLLSGSSKTSGLSVLVDGVGDPVVLGVSSDGLVRRIHQDDLKVLVGGVAVDPVRVQHPQVGGSSADSVFGDGSQRSAVLQAVDTLVGWLTVGGTLWHRSLSATSSDSDSEDDESALGLVAQSSGLVWSRRSRGSVDHSLLSVFPASDSVQESHDIGLLLSLQFFQVFVGTHFVEVVVDEKFLKNFQACARRYGYEGPLPEPRLYDIGCFASVPGNVYQVDAQLSTIAIQNQPRIRRLHLKAQLNPALDDDKP